jgi:hypothetical protein
MNCAFEQTDKLDARGRVVHRCANCRREVGSKYSDPSMVRANCTAGPEKPGIVRRAINFTRAAIEHVRGGRQLVSDEIRAARFAECQACPLFVEGICSHPDCGCPMKQQRSFIDALGWASKKCPLDKWKE